MCATPVIFFHVGMTRISVMNGAGTPTIRMNARVALAPAAAVVEVNLEGAGQRRRQASGRAHAALAHRAVDDDEGRAGARYLVRDASAVGGSGEPCAVLGGHGDGHVSASPQHGSFLHAQSRILRSASEEQPALVLVAGQGRRLAEGIRRR